MNGSSLVEVSSAPPEGEKVSTASLEGEQLSTASLEGEQEVASLVEKWLGVFPHVMWEE